MISSRAFTVKLCENSCKCRVSAGRNVMRECALMESSGRITLEEGMPLWEKESRRVDNLEGDAMCLVDVNHVNK